MTITVRTIFSINATDRSHDFLVIRRGPAGISIEAQSREDEWESATAGPFTPEQLRAALDEVAPAGSYTRTDEDTPEQYREAWQAAERAVLDERAMRREAEQERDEARADLAEYVQAQALRAQPRPLTPDTITDEMIERARKAWIRSSALGNDLWRDVLTGALTEPPARPEGAEDIEDLLADWFGENDDPDQSNRDLADYLVRKGVRVVTEEQP